MAALGAWDEHCQWSEENNFTDLTFGEKENSEQGPTAGTKHKSYASSPECAGVLFQSHWPVLAEQDPSWKPALIKIPFNGRGFYFHMHPFLLCV